MNDIGSTSNNQQLDAICWKCQEMGISYGKLVSQCTDGELRRICDEFQAMQKERRKEKAAQKLKDQAALSKKKMNWRNE